VKAILMINRSAMPLSPHCPCGSNHLYPDCCEPYLSGKALAPTAEALMRSRYTAYSQSQVDYLINTLHPKSRQKDDDLRAVVDHRRLIRQNHQLTQWIGLTILKTHKGQPQDKRGIVEFVAEYRDAKAPGFAAVVNQLHERSRFVKEVKQWFYVDGDMLPPV
jgi:SEC-C motif domain protein